MLVAVPNNKTPEGSHKLLPIGHRIQAHLEQLGQNPAWLADKVGVSRSTITRILKGERNPTPETLQDIAPVLGVTVAQLAADTDAAERVKEAKDLVARKDYEDAVRKVIGADPVSRTPDGASKLQESGTWQKSERSTRKNSSETRCG